MQQLVLDKKPGYVTLVAVLIIGAIATVTAVSLLLISTDSFLFANALDKSNRAKSLANSCAEIALNTLKTNTAYAGNETITIGNGNCQIQTISGSGNTNRTIQTIGTIDNFTRKVRVVVAQVNPTTNITSWQETNF